MPKYIVNRKKAVRIALLLIADAVLVNLSQFLALYIRFEFSLAALRDSGFLDNAIRFAPAYTAISILIIWLARGYSSLWEYISMREAGAIALSGVGASCLQYAIMMLIGLNMPRSFPAMNAVLFAILITGLRFLYRMVRTVIHEQKRTEKRTRTMLIGAGSAGALLMRELRLSEKSRNKIVCIIDDDRFKAHKYLNGVPIVGGREKIGEAVKKYGVKEIAFAIPSCPSSQRRDILRRCQETGCVTKTVPSLSDITSGKVRIQKLRNVSIEDLLGRDSVHVDESELDEHISGKVVLVTGGGGSIGSELCRQIAARKPLRLIILDIYENNAYDIQQELLHKYPALDLVVLIGSVRDKARVDMIFDCYRPEIVYHAAAHKHVPLMEESPNEAIKNNVFGTYNVAEAADRFGTGTFVLISTDKAVNPTNVMGASKRMCEMIIQMFSRKTKYTRFVAVRFGNVLGSNGSVIPLFRRQIERGGPVTVTHKDIIRYFMTIPEAVSLVMQAGVYAREGEIFVLDMGDPVRIDDLARNMIKLSGLEPDVDIKIVYTGLRPGEKMYEELLMSEEGLEKTANDLIYIGHPNDFSDEEFAAALERIKPMCQANSDSIVDEIENIVKTYHKVNT